MKNSRLINKIIYCCHFRIFRQVLNSDMPGSPLPTPFTRKKFLAHCQELIDNPGKLSNEFRLLQTLSVDLQMPTNTACLQANRKKNRYSDILPCMDHISFKHNDSIYKSH